MILFTSLIVTHPTSYNTYWFVSWYLVHLHMSANNYICVKSGRTYLLLELCFHLPGPGEGIQLSVGALSNTAWTLSDKPATSYLNSNPSQPHACHTCVGNLSDKYHTPCLKWVGQEVKTHWIWVPQCLAIFSGPMAVWHCYSICSGVKVCVCVKEESLMYSPL